jgi:hypothetical protein
MYFKNYANYLVRFAEIFVRVRGRIRAQLRRTWKVR